MKGFDYFNALESSGVELPIRIFVEGVHPNLYRPHKVGFCDVTVEDGDEITPRTFERFGCFDVSIVAGEMTEQVRELTKSLLSARPKHLCIAVGETFASWSPDRGWK
jgi:hypothetical protein